MLPDASDLDLKDLDFDGIAVTAAINDKGELCAVGEKTIWEKLVGQTVYFTIRIIVVAKDQRGVPPEFEKPDANPLRVIRATTLREAISKIQEEARPRQGICAFERATAQYLEVFDRSLPIQDHYQLLPLLREVRRERLPRETEGWGEALGEKEIPVAELLRWEEELRGERVAYERLSLDDLLKDFRRHCPQARGDIPRFVVIGPPGSGKSALTQYLAWQAAHGELRIGSKKIVPARVPLRRWERWASKNEEKSLPVYLAKQQYADAGQRHPPTSEDWRRLLDRGDVLLLIDGLDELRGDSAFDEALASALSAWRECPVVLTCRTVSFDQHRNVCPDFPVFALAGLNEMQRETYVRSFPARHPGKFNAVALLEQLRLSPQLLSLAANPLLLAIFCYVIDQSGNENAPATRAAFYDKAVQLLLGKRRKKASRRTLPLIRQRRILERAALELFFGRGQGRQLIFDEAALLGALERGARAESLTSPAEVADEMLRDLPQKPGILRGDSEEGYFFLHLTLHEFLAASALARLVNETETGWETAVPADVKIPSVREFIDRKAWDPPFENLLLFLVAMLADPQSPLALLCDESLDDISHHRLGLAARCLAEIPGDTRKRFQGLFDGITHRVFGLWWNHLRDRTQALVSPLESALPALGQVNGWVKPRQIQPLVRHGAELDVIPLLDYLTALLRESNARVRLDAVHTVGRLGSAAVRADVLIEFKRLFGDTNELLRSAAAWAIEGLGPAAATPEILAELTRLLEHKLAELGRLLDQRDVSNKVDTVFGPLDSAASPPEMFAQLIRRIRILEIVGPDMLLREPAATATEMVPELTQMLRDTNADARRTTLAAIQHLGPAAITPEMIQELTRMLRDDPECLVHVIWAIVALGSAAATPEVLAELTRALGDSGAQRVAVSAIEKLFGVAAFTPEVLAVLSRGLRNADISERCTTIRAIGDLDPLAITPDILAELTRMLRDSSLHVQIETVRAFHDLGSVAAVPEVVTGLCQLFQFQNPDRQLRSVVAVAIGSFQKGRIRLFRTSSDEWVVRTVEQLVEAVTPEKASTPPTASC